MIRADTGGDLELQRAGLAFLPYAPLSGGNRARDGVTPAFARLAELATRRGISVQQAQLAWLLARSPQMLPIPGTSSIAHLEQDMAAAAVVFTPAEVAEIG